MSGGKQSRPGAGVAGREGPVQRKPLSAGKRTLTGRLPSAQLPGTDQQAGAPRAGELVPAPREAPRAKPASEWFLGSFMPPVAELRAAPHVDPASETDQSAARGGASFQPKESGGAEHGQVQSGWFLGSFIPPVADLQAAHDANPALETDVVQRKESGHAEDGHVHEVAQSGIAGSGDQLPHLEAIQRSFGGHDVGHVQAHTNAAAVDAAAALGASAYATSDHVAFRGTPDLHTAAHEAAHVVQQRAGVQLQSGVGRAGDEYERNADAIADRVVSGRSAADLLPDVRQRGEAGRGKQRQIQKRPGEGRASQTDQATGAKESGDGVAAATAAPPTADGVASAPSAAGPQARDTAVYDHAGRLRQFAGLRDPSNPNNTLRPDQMYTIWRDQWASRQAEAQPRVHELERRIHAKNPADYADKIDMFRHGRRDALGPEYEAAANEADLCSAQLSVMSDVLDWLEARKAMGEPVILSEVNRKALEIAKAKSIYTNVMMTALLVGYAAALAGGGVAPATTRGATRGGAPESAATAEGQVGGSASAGKGTTGESGAAAKAKVGDGVGAMRRLTYESAPYHGRIGSGVKSQGPTNGQAALDNSLQVTETSPRRVGIDPMTKEFVIFDRTSTGTFHGHVRTWDELRPIDRAVLRYEFGVSKKGKVPW